MTLSLQGTGIGLVFLTLRCDAPGCSTAQTFTQPGYIAQRAAAHTAGWLERQGSAGRKFFCPTYARGAQK
jgi:hypothetical protein